MARLLPLATVYAAVIAASSCGVERRMGFAAAAAAAAAASSSAAASASAAGVVVGVVVGALGGGAAAEMECGARDRPGRDDPGYDYDDDHDASSEHQRPIGGRTSNSKVSGPTDARLGESSAASAPTTTTAPQARGGGEAPSGPRFKSGDVIELYNAGSSDVQIVFPSIVRGREATTETGTGNADYAYKVVKTTDGKEVGNLPEKFLHAYVPYGVGDEALCNIGEFEKSRPIIVRCTILGYEPAAMRGAMVLQGKYGVRVHETRANDEYVTTLPVWKLQRRYLASASKGSSSVAAAG